MPLSNYQGPPGYIAVLRHLVGETIKSAFVDAKGHIWLVVPSGHAFVMSAFDTSADSPFRVEDPQRTQQEIDKRRIELQGRIQELKYLAPGIDV